MFKGYWLTWLTLAFLIAWIWFSILMEACATGRFKVTDDKKLLDQLALFIPLLILVIRYEADRSLSKTRPPLSREQVDQAAKVAKALREAVGE